MILTTVAAAGALLVVGAAALYAPIAAMTSFLFVKEKQDVVLESFGKYVQTRQSAGLQFKLPWPFQNVGRKISTALLEFKEDLSTKTKDDIFVTLPIKMHLQVTDSKKFNYASRDPITQVMSRVAQAVKQLSSGMEFAELYQARETISEHARKLVGKEISDLYGMELVDVIVDEPHAPQEIQRSYNSVKASERNKLAAVNEAEANKIRTIAEAEARKEALRLDGEGIAAQRKAIFENYANQFNELSQRMSPEQAHQVIALAMTNDTVRDAAKHGNVIVTTTNAGNILGELQALGKTMTDPAKKAAANDGGAGGPKISGVGGA